MKAFLIIAKNTWNENFAYRLNFILWRVRVIIRFLIIYFLWSSVYKSGFTGFGYTQQMMLTYVFLVYIISNFVFATRTQDIGSEINEGKLTNYLLKPLSFVKHLLARDISDKLLNFGFTLIETGVLLFLLKPPFFIQTNSFLILLTLITIFFSVSIYFFISFILGCIGFWTTEVWAIRFIFLILLDYLSGNFFPIDILPEALKNFLMLTPFPYLYYFPTKIYLGDVAVESLIKGLLISGIWFGILYWLTTITWKRGLKVYTADGR